MARCQIRRYNIGISIDEGASPLIDNNLLSANGYAGIRISGPATVPHIRANRDGLVLKPNDEYGGKGVHIGWEMTESEWDVALTEALASSFVVQAKVDLQRETFPEIGADGLHFRDLVVDLDPFVFNGEVEGFLTRLSGTSLANVTSGGGQVPAFLVEPLS